MSKIKSSQALLRGWLLLVMFTTTAIARADLKSGLFSVAINGKAVQTNDYKDFTYAYFVQKGKVNVTVTFSQTVEDVKISPLERGIRFEKKDRTIQFELLQPDYTVITINKKHRLFLFADKEFLPEISNVIRITEYVSPNDTAVVTSAIQKALDDASRSGKQLIFPAGTYVAGSLFIHRNTNLFFEQGAVLKASENLADYVRNKEIGASIFITVKEAEQVTIGGPGTIDGSGKVIRDKFGDRGRIRLMTVYRSKDITLSGLTLRDPAAWNTHIFKSTNVNISRLKLLNDITVPTTDGFDPDASSAITIEHCFAYCSDDNVAVKLTPKNDTILVAKNIAVRNCVFLTLKSALKVGTETRGASITDVLFENNDVIRSDRGMAIYVPDGATVTNIRFINNRFEESYPDLKQMGIQFRLNKRTAESRVGQISDILVKDCKFLLAFPKPSEVSGFDKEHKTQVVFDNLQIAGKKCLSLSDANIQSSAFSDTRFQ